jgi:hypothetical protein
MGIAVRKHESLVFYLWILYKSHKLIAPDSFGLSSAPSPSFSTTLSVHELTHKEAAIELPCTLTSGFVWSLTGTYRWAKNGVEWGQGFLLHLSPWWQPWATLLWGGHPHDSFPGPASPYPFWCGVLWTPLLPDWGLYHHLFLLLHSFYSPFNKISSKCPIWVCHLFPARV